MPKFQRPNYILLCPNLILDLFVPDTGDLLVNPENGYEWGGQTVAHAPVGKQAQNAINIINAVLMRKSAVAQLTK